MVKLDTVVSALKRLISEVEAQELVDAAHAKAEKAAQRLVADTVASERKRIVRALVADGYRKKKLKKIIFVD